MRSSAHGSLIVDDEAFLETSATTIGRLILVGVTLTTFMVSPPADATHLPGIEDLQRTLLNPTTAAGSNNWTRNDRFENTGSETIVVPGVEFLFLNPEEVGFGDVTSANALSVQAAAISMFPDFDFIGVSWWDDGDAPQRTYTNSGTFTPLNLSLEPGEFFDLSTIAQFIGPGCGPCDATVHSELVVGWHFTSVPEPSTAALFGLGIAMIGMSRRRRK